MTTPETPAGRQRVKRPEPARTRPVRGGWFDLFGAPGAPPQPAGPSPGAANGDSRSNPLNRAVDLGYRVVDDYIRQGQNAARLVAQQAYGPAAFQQDAQDMLARMAQYTSEFWAMWFDVVGSAATGWPNAPTNSRAPESPTSPAPPSPSDRPSSSGSPPAQTRSAVCVSLDADGPVELLTDLRPIADGASLRVQALRSASPHVPLLDDLQVSCEGPGAPVVVRIRIPRDQPAGTYCGVVVDETTNVPVGTIQVRIPGIT